MHSPKVSVIIPVYNVAPYLPQCLDSLCCQTLTEIEILCIDDASADNSAQIVLDYQKKDPRIRLLQQSHQGVSAARNLGIRQARGPYITFIDGDDWAEPSMLETLLKKAEETGSDVAICASQVHFLQKNLLNARRRRSLQGALTVTDRVWQAGDPDCTVWQLMALPGTWPFVWNKLIRTELLAENAITFSPELSLGEDGVFLHLLFQYAKKVVFLPQMLHHYRYQRKDSATVRQFDNRSVRFRQHIGVAGVMLQEFQERAFPEESMAQLLRWLLNFLYNDFVGLPAQERSASAAALHRLFAQYDLLRFSGTFGFIQKKRLQLMTDGSKTCTEASRILDVIRTKVENRLLRYWGR